MRCVLFITEGDDKKNSKIQYVNLKILNHERRIKPIFELKFPQDN